MAQPWWVSTWTIIANLPVPADVNCDGTIDIADAVAVLDIIASNEYDEDADLNDDGKIDIADFVGVLDFMAMQ